MNGRTRRRGAALDDAILEAAAAELEERGWAGFGIDGVSRRCGTAKAVVYRRWANRVELAQAVLARMTAESHVENEPSGDLRTDLVAFLEGTAHFLGGPFGEAVRGTLYEASPAHRASMLGDRVIVSDVARIIDDAVARGELEHPPSPAAMNLGHAVAMSEFLHTGLPPIGTAIAVLVDELWVPALTRTGPRMVDPIGGDRTVSAE
ncbi:TetR family transcriptional regulator [Agromyces luteolus]|uniref:TetR family transcriptional regulator n=1 Tax=Agromyces luteolus TaxID=88373 RepID=A0A7C9MIZ7_9MICO|nr:TetR family transcriptional regulator [Agromyces luteolus]MUN08258.1 TetR family transcriptional regulator [Agromyces luteolus]GLK26791.1 TetR family transcriptional regulator [Agromyces luteolus]